MRCPGRLSCRASEAGAARPCARVVLCLTVSPLHSAGHARGRTTHARYTLTRGSVAWHYGSRRACGVRCRASSGRVGFADEDGDDAASGRVVVPPPSALYGLTSFQMEALGLTGEEVARRLTLSEVRGLHAAQLWLSAPGCARSRCLDDDVSAMWTRRVAGVPFRVRAID